jgi:hypothetical protein
MWKVEMWNVECGMWKCGGRLSEDGRWKMGDGTGGKAEKLKR